MWRRLRAEGWPISSSWIDEAGAGETKDFAALWRRIVAEIGACDGLVLYAEPSDLPLHGPLVEAGAALAAGKRVAAVLPGIIDPPKALGSWLHHPLVAIVGSLEQARAWAVRLPKPRRLCADCRHFFCQPAGLACTHPALASPVDGVAQANPDHERGEYGLCGPRGTLWEPML